MVLAAGRATRLRPLTDAIAKPALPFVGRSVLDRVLDGLAEAGVTEAVVNLHHAPDTVRDLVRRRGRRPPRVTFSDETGCLLGTGGALVPVRDLFWREPEFLLVNGDCVHAIDHLALIAEHRAKKPSATLSVRGGGVAGFRALAVDGDECITAFGVPSVGAANERHYLSVQVLDPDLLELLPEEPAPLDSFSGWYQPALEAGHVFRVVATEAEWHALDSRELYLDSSADYVARRGGESHVEPGARVHEGAVIAPGTVIEDGAEVGEGATLTSSIVLQRARIGAGAVVARSIIGPDAHVAPGARVSEAIIAPGATVP